MVGKGLLLNGGFHNSDIAGVSGPLNVAAEPLKLYDGCCCKADCLNSFDILDLRDIEGDPIIGDFSDNLPVIFIVGTTGLGAGLTVFWALF